MFGMLSDIQQWFEISNVTMKNLKKIFFLNIFSDLFFCLLHNANLVDHVEKTFKALGFQMWRKKTQ